MQVEVLLERAKKENVYGDERDKQIRQRRDSFATWCQIILIFVMMFMKIIAGESALDMIILCAIVAESGFLYEWKKTGNKVELVFGVVFSIMTIVCFYKFCVGLF